MAIFWPLFVEIRFFSLDFLSLASFLYFAVQYNNQVFIPAYVDGFVQGFEWHMNP